MSTKLATHFLEQLKKFDKRSFRARDPSELRLLTLFMRHFLVEFLADTFAPSRKQMLEFIELNENIANLMYIAGQGDSEESILALLSRADEVLVLHKVMTLYSARNTLQLSPDFFFERDPEAASIWYSLYIGYIDWAGIDAERIGRIRRMAAHIPERLVYVDQLAAVYFTCTFVGEPFVPPLRRRIHALMGDLTTVPQVPTRPSNKRRIGLVTDRWKPDNVVHRALSPFIHGLASVHEITLIHHRKEEAGLDLQGIVAVESFIYDSRKIEEVKSLANRFDMLLFADVGMCIESIFLASLRLAPIQVALSGHPESTWSPVMDYFVHGTDVIETAKARLHFSERLVLIPGYGHLCTRPDYEWRRIKPVASELRIACCWGAQKLNPEHLQHLAAALQGVERPVKFVFLGLVGNCVLPIETGLHALLGAEHVETHGSMSYKEFMQKLEGCHFAVDAWPFGGCLTVTDLLWLRKPVIALRGERSFNRNASYLQSRLGLVDMAVDTPETFINLLKKMMVDDDFRQDACTRLEQANVEDVLLSREPVPAFVNAIGLLFESHETFIQDETRIPITVDA